jgi:hypothetical protein
MRAIAFAGYGHIVQCQDGSSKQDLTSLGLVCQVQAYYNFSPLTVALSVNYMDRFMSRHHLPVSRPVLAKSTNQLIELLNYY